MALLNYFLRILFGPFLWLARRVLFCVSALFCRRCGSFWLVNHVPKRERAKEPADFYTQIAMALKFIEERDPRRFHRLEKHIDYITNASRIGWGGLYKKETKSCYVNYPRYYEYVVGKGELDARAQEVLTMELASIILHEATHGRVEDAGIAYRGERRERIEKLCRRQEVQFLNRAKPDYQNIFGQVVDWSQTRDFEQVREDYEEYWQRTGEYSWWKDTLGLRSYWWLLCQIYRRLVRRPICDEKVRTWLAMHKSYTEFAQDYEVLTEAMLHARAHYQWGAKNFYEAIKDLDYFFEKKISYAALEAVNLLAATSWYHLRQWDKALAIVEEAASKDEPYVGSWLAGTLFHMKRFDEALTWIDREIARGETVHSIYWRSWALVAMQRYEEALESYDQGLARDDKILPGEIGYSMLAERALLLQKLGDQTRFEQDGRQLSVVAEAWWQSCHAPPKEIDAFVIESRYEVFHQGILGSTAYVLICPEFANSPEPPGFLEGIAKRLLMAKDSCSSDHNSSDYGSNRYDTLYLNSLLYVNDDFPWRKVPEEVTAGRQVFVVDMKLDRLFLPDEVSSGDYLRCLLAPCGRSHTAYLNTRIPSSC